MADEINEKKENDKTIDYSEELDIEGMPEGVRAFVKANKVPEGVAFSSSLYRLSKDGRELKKRRRFLERIENEFHQGLMGEVYVQNKYGGGEFQSVVSWPKPNQTGETGIQMEPMFIDGPPKAIVYDEEEKSVPDAQMAQATAPQSPPPVAGGGILSGFSIEKLVEHLPTIISAVEMIKGFIPKPDYSVLDKVMNSQVSAMENFGKQVSKMQMDLIKTNIDNVSKMGENMTKEQPGEATDWPKWLEPYAPVIERVGATILDDSWIAKKMRKTLLGSKVFKDAWIDPDKKASGIAAMVEHFGEELGAQFEDSINAFYGE